MVGNSIPLNSYKMIENEPEISNLENEYSDDDEPEDIELYRVTVEVPKPVVRLITLIVESVGTTFLIEVGIRRIYPYRFDIILDKMRVLI